METILRSIVNSLASETQGDPSIRQDVLATICKHTGAAAGKWVLVEDSKNANRVVAECGAMPAELQLASTEQGTNGMVIQATSAYGSEARTLILELSNQNRIYGFIILVFEKQSQCDSAVESLSSIRGLLSFFEDKNRLRKLLDGRQETLRSISEEGANLAKKNSRLFQQLITNEKRMTGISRGIIKMQEEERAKISRELHDGIGQALLALKMHLDVILTNPTAAGEKLNEARRLTEQTLEEVRQLSRLLRPPMLDDLGLMPTLRSYVKAYTERTGIHVSLTATGMERRLDPDVETMFFRVTQEGLNNVLKHSGAQNVTIVISASTSRILFELSDDGKGFVINSPSELKGSGILGIRDRVTLLGGEFSIRSGRWAGTKLRIKLPMRKAIRKSKASRG